MELFENFIGHFKLQSRKHSHRSLPLCCTEQLDQTSNSETVTSSERYESVILKWEDPVTNMGRFPIAVQLILNEEGLKRSPLEFEVRVP